MCAYPGHITHLHVAESKAWEPWSSNSQRGYYIGSRDLVEGSEKRLKGSVLGHGHYPGLPTTNRELGEQSVTGMGEKNSGILDEGEELQGVLSAVSLWLLPTVKKSLKSRSLSTYLRYFRANFSTLTEHLPCAMKYTRNVNVLKQVLLSRHLLCIIQEDQDRYGGLWLLLVSSLSATHSAMIQRDLMEKYQK